MSKSGTTTVIVLGVLGMAALGLATIFMVKRKRQIVDVLRPRTRAYVASTEASDAETRTRTSRFFKSSPSPPGTPQNPAEDDDGAGIQLINNPGGGDCLFHCFKDALSRAKVKSSIKELRGVVAKAATEDQFQTLKVIYDSAVTEKEFGLINDYLFMSGVENLAGLKRAMMKRSYWGEEMAVRALEEATGVRAIVFTTKFGGNMQIAKDIGNTLQVPPPSKQYIMLLLHDMHYQLIEYNGRAIMKKARLPPEVQEAIDTPLDSPEETDYESEEGELNINVC